MSKLLTIFLSTTPYAFENPYTTIMSPPESQNAARALKLARDLNGQLVHYYQLVDLLMDRYESSLGAF